VCACVHLCPAWAGGCVWGGCVWGEGGCSGRGCLRTSAAMPWAGRLRVVTAECACAATGAAALRMPRADLSAAVSLGLCSVALGWSFGAASFIDEGLLSRSTSYGVCPCSARYVGKAAQETALGSLRWLRPTSEQSGAGEGRHICTGTFGPTPPTFTGTGLTRCHVCIGTPQSLPHHQHQQARRACG
jgi:hypothetical protein